MRRLEHLGILTIAKRNALYLVYAGDSIPPVLGVPGDPVSEESALFRNRKLSRSDPGFAKEGPRGFASQHKEIHAHKTSVQTKLDGPSCITLS